VLENIFFDVNKWTLKKESNAELNLLLKFLNLNLTVKVELAGHTDSDGDKESNQILSENRAKAVVDWLVLKGIAEDRMTFLGYGDTMPLLPNTSVENKAKNRRTELKIQ
jgi:outer membrane protein OmpA-like peptidoglycan-associated protein